MVTQKLVTKSFLIEFLTTIKFLYNLSFFDTISYAIKLLALIIIRINQWCWKLPEIRLGLVSTNFIKNLNNTICEVKSIDREDLLNRTSWLKKNRYKCYLQWCILDSRIANELQIIGFY